MLYAADVFLTPVRMLPGQEATWLCRRNQTARESTETSTPHHDGRHANHRDRHHVRHANLLPFTLLVDKICHRAITRKFVADHRSALTELVFAYNIHIEATETILPIRFHPRWKPPHSIDIATDKEEATRDEGDWCRRPGIRVYSDGSDVDGGVGAAAVLFKPGNPGYKVLRFHLGSSDDHSVYEAEVVGLLLGTELLKTERSLEGASIAADNKSSIQATKLRRPAPAHYLLDSLHKHLRALGRKHHEAKVTIRWVPGHMDLEGNETADLEAKRAARGDSSPIEDLPDILRDGLPRSATKMRQVFLTDLQGKAKTTWNSSLPNLSPASTRDSPPGNMKNSLEKMPRRQANILFQLRTEHVPLQKHLHRIRRAESPICPACHAAPETVHHFLLTCPAHAHHRWAHLDRALGHAGRSLSCLLNTSTAMKPLFSFINATGRLSETFGNATAGKRTNRQTTQRSAHH
ncbi:hypothetical protein A0H81_12025 [Grifola frondosa]|uniref:RNase H type-1 domain-containing protein n=1 Tax=Grifola frondosa TaxID=5627 RepID=A0A1C7LTM8_GRIFR|nr:hypothetical protein A0H81_12025 [Grifola frondosa]